MGTDATSWHRSGAVDVRVEALLRQLTLEEKIDLVSSSIALGDDGAQRVSSQPYQIPAFSIADGTAGVRVTHPAAQKAVTALPAAIALAATWSEDAARQHGDVLGAETAATGHNILLSPAIDIARAPHAGRTFESFGEDPLLQARLAAPVIEAIQAHGVQACIKHYVANNQEHERNSIDVRVDERTLHEIYLRPFRAAVHAGVASVMGSYNKVNGTFACEHPQLLTTILREELGFRGYVMSDFLANHSTAESANAGLDWELSNQKLWGPYLLAAVQNGQVNRATLDEMVRRILRPTVGLGLFDRPLAVTPLPVERHGEMARSIAEQSIVLLKNEGGLLPLSPEVRSIAVIGPDADTIAAAGGGSAWVQATYAVSVLGGIRRRAGDGVRVVYAPGTDPVGTGALLAGPAAVPSAVLSPPNAAPGQCGLRAEYWTNLHWEGEASLVRIEPQVELNRGFFDIPGLGGGSPKIARLPFALDPHISARWSGTLIAPASGDYLLSLTALGTARLFLDGQLLIDAAYAASGEEQAEQQRTAEALWSGGGALVSAARLQLRAGEPLAIMIEYAADVPGLNPVNGAQIRFGWEPPEDAVMPLIAEAASLAQQADLAIVVAHTFESEAQDRPHLRLPQGQDQLIRAVAAVNPHTVVVLMSGAPVEIAGWEEQVPAILEAWYAGQEQGSAVGRVLWGDVNPSGKLPLTFPRSEAETPVASRSQYPGLDGVVTYSEGVFVGYRGYDHFGIEPQYPFGHGLSYTSFAYAGLALTPPSLDGAEPMLVHFTLANNGDRAGVEVAQVYVGMPPGANAPPKQLVGWARVQLEPGEQQYVTVTIDPQAPERPLSCWDSGTHSWRLAVGDYQVYVAASSRDLRLSGTIHIN